MTVVVVLVHRIRQFLLTRPSRGVTCWIALVILVILFLLTRPSRGVTNIIHIARTDIFISTHTPLAGRDGSDGGHRS